MKSMAHLLKALGIGALAILAGCERPPTDTVQHGYRGTGMVQVYNPRTVEANADLHAAPIALPAAAPDGTRADKVYKNVKVLGDLSVGDFTRLMVSMSSWIAPNEGCTYCHNAANFAEDSKYTKVVARRMIEMTKHINTDWQPHVAQTGVTCYTCHRGQPVPSQLWFREPPQNTGADFIGDAAGQNKAALSVTWSSLPSDPFTPFLLENKDIRVNGTKALPGDNRHSIKQAEWTYGLMTHMSSALGVNCTYCHNTQSFSNWTGNPPQRVKAWHGIRMARDLNLDYMEPLQSTFPPHRLGPMGDTAKVNCATCHQGAYKPLNGAQMAKDFPELLRPVPSKVASK